MRCYFTQKLPDCCPNISALYLRFPENPTKQYKTRKPFTIPSLFYTTRRTLSTPPTPYHPLQASTQTHKRIQTMTVSASAASHSKTAGNSFLRAIKSGDAAFCLRARAWKCLQKERRMLLAGCAKGNASDICTPRHTYKKKPKRVGRERVVRCLSRKIFSGSGIYSKSESQKWVHVMSRQINETIKVRGEEE